MNKALEISTVPVTIRILNMGEEKLTKSVFSQIQESWPFSYDFFEYHGADILGYVFDCGHKHLVFVSDGELRRCDISGVELFAKSEIGVFVKDFLARYSIYPIESTDAGALIEECFDKSDLPAIQYLKSKAKTFCEGLKGMQVYISD